MRKVSYVIDSGYLRNAIFDIQNLSINRDNCLTPFYEMRQLFRHKLCDLSTYDINKIQDSEIVIYNDLPKKLPDLNDIHKSYLIIFESQLIRPDNWDLKNHKYFKKIFTWNDQFIDNEKYFKINFSHSFPNKINKDLANKKNLCTLISGNKRVNHTQELYSKRIEVIRWFEKYHPADFEFYGVGWQEFKVPNKYGNYLLKKLKLSTLFKDNYPSYRGTVVSKKETLKHYRFVICYENARDVSGYITEKIFDCFFAGCIPIYWGADNVNQHIPKECFIDKREFDSYQALYNHMVSMPTQEYLRYLNDIECFLKSPQADSFRAETFAQTIVDTVLDDLNAK